MVLAEDTLALGYGYETKEYSEDTAREIDEEIKAIIKDSWNKAEKVLMDHRKELDELAEMLLSQEEIDEKEFEDFFKKNSK